ncbi:nitronate monooxygenase [Flavobacterium sp. GSB-24]|uniref:nitronate monooxygenase n=1 Tax=Flavobacterium sp. GSB-24 TaxID=2994319 RepID=UPI00249125F5|nr:nitronate monooxygenase [Flavobacterium sp. GSB-24]
MRNAFIEEVENTEFVLPYPYQNKLTAELRKASKLVKNPDFVGIWAGQSITDYSEISTGNLIKNLIEEVEKFSVK